MTCVEQAQVRVVLVHIEHAHLRGVDDVGYHFYQQLQNREEVRGVADLWGESQKAL